MKQVFISYTTCDKEKTTEIRDYLEKEGITCWMGNRDIPGGANYTKEITTAIRQCQVFVLILSEAAQKSDYVFRELDFAVKQKKSVVPYLIEEQNFTDEFYFLLSSTNGIHAYEDLRENKQKLKNRLLELISPKFDIFSERPRRKRTTKRFIVCPRCRAERLKRSISFRDELLINDQLLYRTIFLSFFCFLTVCLCILKFFPDSTFRKAIVTMLMWPMDLLDVREEIKTTISTLQSFRGLTSRAKTGFLAGNIWLYILWFIYYKLGKKVGIKIRDGCLHERFVQEIDIHTFRCCNCNKKFRITIPIRQQDRYYIKDLVEEDKIEFTKKVIDFIQRFLTLRTF